MTRYPRLIAFDPSRQPPPDADMSFTDPPEPGFPDPGQMATGMAILLGIAVLAVVAVVTGLVALIWWGM